MKQIQEYTSVELLTELSNRCSPCAFIGCKTEEGGEMVHFFDWSGSDAACFGLVHTLLFHMNRDMVSEEVRHSDCEGTDNEG